MKNYSITSNDMLPGSENYTSAIYKTIAYAFQSSQINQDSNNMQALDAIVMDYMPILYPGEEISDNHFEEVMRAVLDIEVPPSYKLELKKLFTKETNV